MTMKVLVCLFALVVLCCALESKDVNLFNDFISKYQKSYTPEQYATRFEVFASNLKYIREYNAEHGAILGINKFADLTNEEFRASRTQKSVVRKSGLPSIGGSASVSGLPPTFEWSNETVVGPVQDQGQCGSSEIFATIDSIASVYAIQQDVAYEGIDYNQLAQCLSSGCNGGEEGEVIKYIEAHGLSFQFDGTCPKGKVASGVCITNQHCVAAGNETALAVALVAQGPLFVTVDGSLMSFQMYEGGIYAPSGCSTTNLDTSLLVIGYTQNTWICQNSWGADWGVNGYIYIARNQGNMCGIASLACYPEGVSKC